MGHDAMTVSRHRANHGARLGGPAPRAAFLQELSGCGFALHLTFSASAAPTSSLDHSGSAITTTFHEAPSAVTHAENR